VLGAGLGLEIALIAGDGLVVAAEALEGAADVAMDDRQALHLGGVAVTLERALVELGAEVAAGLDEDLELLARSLDGRGVGRAGALAEVAAKVVGGLGVVSEVAVALGDVEQDRRQWGQRVRFLVLLEGDGEL